MRKLVVDAGAALRLVREERAVPRGLQLLAPTLLRSETLSLLHAAVHAKKLGVESARVLLARLGKLPIRLLGDAVLRRRAWEVADELGWAGTFVAEYVALTQLQGDALVTTNARLARQLRGVVEVAPFTALLGRLARPTTNPSAPRRDRHVASRRPRGETPG